MKGNQAMILFRAEPDDEITDDDLNRVFSKLAAQPAKITWAMAGRVTEPGRYMFMQAMLAAVTAAGMTVKQNRAALAGKLLTTT